MVNQESNLGRAKESARGSPADSLALSQFFHNRVKYPHFRVIAMLLGYRVG